MSDLRRRRRVPSDDESETPPIRRRRYNTRSAVREEERHSLWRAMPTVNIVRIPFVNIGDYTRIRDLRHSGSNLRGDSSRSQSRNGVSESRSRDGASSSWSRDGAAGSHSRDGASTSAAASSGYSRHLSRTEARSSSSRRPAAALSNSPREENGGSSRVRTYTAMSTGGRRRSEAFERGTRDSSSARLLVRNRPIPPRRASAEAARRMVSRVLNTGRERQPDDDFTAVMRSLELVRAQGGRGVVAFSRLGERRSENGRLSPRPSRGSNIVSRSSSSRVNRSAASASSPALTIEDIIGSQMESGLKLHGIPPPPSRLIRATARMSTGHRRPPPFLSRRRRESGVAQASNAARTRIATGRGNGDHIRYDMTHTGGRLNIRVAFGTEDDDSEPTERLFSISGDSDATTYLNSLSDIDMSADDVFYSDADRQESDSGESSESGSTATPHSLVSLSLNALHPSPTPSLSSAETNHNMDADGYTTEPEPEEEEDDEEEPTTDEVDEEDAGGTSSIFSRTVGNPIIFLHNNISVHLLSSMAELAETFSSLRDRLQQTAGPGDGFRGFTPPRNYPEPTRRRVPEGVDCQRAKLIDELNSNTSECVICTDTIKAVDKVWPCSNCFNIFHLPCIRKWAKTNRATEVGGAWICPVCRRPKFCGPNKLRYRCLCGRRQKPKPMPGVTPHCCGKPCRHKCGLLCHPGPCKMSEAEAATFANQPEGARPSAPATSEGATE